MRIAKDTDLEHVFPQSLGGSDVHTLPGNVVCKRCNNGLAHLDRSVSDEFDFPAFFAGIRRKGGAPPQISSRGNFFAESHDDVPRLYLNLDPEPVVMPNNRRLAPNRRQGRDVVGTVRTEGTHQAVSIEVQFGQGKKFIRGLTKIALNVLALLVGPDKPRDAKYDHIRQFVRHGGSRRHALLMPSQDDLYVLQPGPCWQSQSGFACVQFRIASILFLVDLSPDEHALHHARRSLLAQQGIDAWICLPTEV